MAYGYKKSFYLLMIGVFLALPAQIFAHGEVVHQHMTYESYYYLKQQLGYSILELENNLGYVNSTSSSTIVGGSFLEDDSDMIWHFEDIITWANDDALITATHFWKADQGDNQQNNFIDYPAGVGVTVPGGPFPNAFQKIKLYAYNNKNWKFWYYFSGTKVFPLADGGSISATSRVQLTYDSIIDFYKYGKAYITRFDVSGIQINGMFEVILDQNARNSFVWEILGRMVHLLQDMSVPAHAHGDSHGFPTDQYEDWAGTYTLVGGVYVSALGIWVVPPDTVYNYRNWNNLNVGGNFINATNESDPLHFLMYTTQQIADHFGSSGPTSFQGDGNDVIGGNYTTTEINYLNNINLYSLGSPTYQSVSGYSTSQLENIRDKTFPHVIRATAGLYYWFAKEAGLLNTIHQPPAVELSTFSVDRNNLNLANGTLIAKNYPNPFNPVTKIDYQLDQNNFVNLKVYNMLGQEVAVLVNSYKEVGYYTVEFNGKNLSSGFFLAKLRVGDKVSVKKMLLQK